MADKPLLFVDIDDTIADTFPYFVSLANERFGNPDGLDDGEIVRRFGIMPNVPFWQTPEVLLWLAAESVSSERQEKIPPVPGAIDGVWRLAERYAVAYATSRPESVREGTVRWLVRHGFPEGELHMRTGEFELVNGNLWKASLVRERGAIAVVDDNPEILRALELAGETLVCLFGSHPERPVAGIANVVECASWDDVTRALLG